MPKLIIRLQNQEWTVDLQDGSHVIGRASQCAIALKDPSLSRQHCEIQIQGGVATLMDRGSMNGTLVNGRRASTHRLLPGDKIQIGQTILWYERKNVAAEVPPPAPASEIPAPSPTSPTRRSVVGADPEAERSLRDYVLRSRGGRGWGRVAAVVAALAALGLAAFLARNVLSGGARPAGTDPDNLVARDPSFNASAAGRPEFWTLRVADDERPSSALSIDPVQGREGTGGLVLEKAGSASDLVVEAVYREDLPLGTRRALQVSAWARAAGFGGLAALRVDWLARPRGPVVAEEASPPTAVSDAWTPLRWTFVRPPGAGAARLALAAAGPGGRLCFDDFSVRFAPAPPEGAAAERRRASHQVLATRQGVLQVALRGKPVVFNLQARLESEKAGGLPQILARETALAEEAPDLVAHGRMPSPVDLRDVEFDERVSLSDHGARVSWRFSGEPLRQIDRLSLAASLPRSARVQGVPEAPDARSARLAVSSEEGDFTIEISRPARVGLRSADGRPKLVLGLACEPGAEEAELAIEIREAGAGSGSGDPLQAARRAREGRRFGEALALLRQAVKDTRDPALRDRMEAELKSLEETQRQEWADVRARGFEARLSRRPDDLTRALEALERFAREWSGGGLEGSAEELRESLRAETASASDAEAERARRILERARACAGAGQTFLARQMLQALLAAYPQSEAASEARALLGTLRP
jgi:hypothetical protein